MKHNYFSRWMAFSLFLFAICFTSFQSTAQYCASNGTGGNGHYIQETYNPINPSAPFNDQRVTGSGSYSDFTGSGARWSFVHGQGEDIAITLAHPNTTINHRRYWIDYNQNNVFDASELVVDQTFNPPFNSSTYLANTINIPSSALSGNTRMRVSVKLGSAPTACETGFDGEVEDYLVSIGPPLLNTVGTDLVSVAPGGALNVYFSTDAGVYNAGNIFTIQLSNASGSFAAPVSIGTLNSTSGSGTISCSIPGGQALGAGYRVRVVASNPSTTAVDNGLDIEITNTPAVPTALSAGDIAFVGANTDDAEQFTFVLLKDINARTLISFTDIGWENSPAGFVSFSSSHGEGTISWYHTSNLSCGTMVTMTDGNTSAPGGFTASLGQTADNGFGLGTNGDQIFCYTGPSANPNFVAGLHIDYSSSNFNATTNWSNDHTGSSRSELPPGLTNGVSAVAVFTASFSEQDNSRYNCPTAPTSDSPANLATAINTQSNWVAAGTRYTLPPACTFTCASACPSISANITGGGGICPGSSTNISVTITGGTGPYSITIDNGVGTITSYTSGTNILVSPASTTTYSLTAASDAMSCPATLGGSATVTVLDATAPVAVCPSSINDVELNASGMGTLPANIGDGSSTDNCGTPTETSPSATYGCADIGAQSVVLTANDGNGNMNNATCNFMVVDNIDPEAVCPTIPDVILDGSGNGTLPANIGDGSSTDNCGTAIEISNSANYTCADLGTQAVNLVVSDGNGNTDAAVCFFNVTDTTAPVAVCPANLNIYLDASGSYTLAAMTLGDGSSTDNCGVVLENSTGVIFSCNDAGTTYTNGITASDASGNTNTAVCVLSILDTIAPSAICPTIADVNLDVSGNGTLPANIGGGLSTDNCSMVTETSPTQSFTCADLGIQSVVLTADDGNGNVDTQSCNFMVVDTVAPIAICKDITVQLDASGNQTIAEDSVNDNSTDACGGLTFDTDITNFSCSDIPFKTVILTVTDASGNSSTCVSTVTVEDTIPPTVTCNDFTVYLNASGTRPITTGLINSVTNASDNCGLSGIHNLTGTNPRTCAQLGTSSITLFINDQNGNTSICQVNITVLDTFPPIAVCPASIADVALDSAGNGMLPTNIGDNSSTDNCSITETSLSANYTCADLGPQSVELVATDAGNNSDTVSCIFNVVDNISPVITCPGDVMVNNDMDSCSAMVSGLVASATDNCGVATITNNSPFAMSNGADASGRYPVGTTVVEFIATDASGNADTCEVSVTVTDDQLPTASCKLNIAVSLDGNGQVFVGVGLINNNSSDNCGLASLTLSKQVFTCADLGFNSVVLTATDLSGNQNACVTNIAVQDNLKPNAICLPSVTVGLDSTGNATVDGSAIDGGSTDNCGVDALSVSPASFSCADIGSASVVLTVSDATGNSKTCVSTVNIVDNLPPVAICQGVDVSLDSMGNATISTMDVNNGSSDNCAIDSMSLDQSSFGCGDVGDNIVTLTVWDQSGNMNSCSDTVRVSDDIDPVTACMNISVDLDSTGNVSIDSNAIDAGSSDNCGIASIAVSPSSFDCSDVGINNVAQLVTDVNGNTSTCTALITVNDVTNPTAVCQDVTVQLDSSGNGSITTMDVNNGSSDACGIDTMTLDNSTYNCSDVGTSSVILTVTDVNGNTATCGAQVTVEDNVDPVALCNDLTVQLDSSGNGSITATMVDNGSSDACGIDTLTLDKSSFSCADVGTDTVTLTARDVNGNTGSCQSIITIEDNVAPEAVCQTFAVQLNTFGSGNLSGSDIDGGSSDACGIASLNSDLSSFSCADVGTNFTALLTVTDNNGNTDTCSAAVTVEDNVKPAANCRNITVALDAAGNVMITPTDVDNFSFDACGIAGRVIDVDSFSCAEVGPNTVSLTVTDVNGNDSTCTSTVTVVDLIPPMVTCQDATVTLDNAGMGSLMVSDVFVSATDVCGVDSSWLSQDTFSCADLGVTMIELVVSDVNGALGFCDVDVTVVDTTAPAAVCNDISIALNASGTATIASTDLDGGSTDACGIETIIAEQTNFSCADVGMNTIQLLVIDSSNNIGTCSSQVTVSDTTDPMALCKNATVNVGANGQAAITPSTVNNGSSDACGIASLSVSPTTVGCTGSGTIATLTVTDNNGNVDSCTSVITVMDKRNPTALCIQGISVGLDSISESVTVAASVIGGNSFDNCGIVSLTLTPNTFDCDDVGQNAVQIKATDAAGNNGFCNTNIDVQDIFGVCIENCPAPQNTSTTMISYTTARVNWDTVGNAVGYVVQGRPVGAGFTVSLSIPSGATSFKDVGALNPNTSYEWQIKTICSNSESVFTPLETFTTLSCNVPTSASENILSNSQVELQWTPVAGAIGYRITGGTPSAPNAATLDVTGQSSSSFLVTGLMPGQTYVWRIRAICSANPFVASANTTTRMFTMPILGVSQAKDPESGLTAMPTRMELYPNPNEGRFQVEVSHMDEAGQLVIYDMLGRIVSQQQVAASPSQRVRIDMSNHETGTYMIRLIYGDEQIVKRVVIQ